MAIPGADHLVADQAQFVGPGVLRPGTHGPRRQAVHASTSSARCRSTPRARPGPIWADENDPRATDVGAFLRRHDLDEWPQFWNVLVGDMSIVGPRPERPFFVEQFKHRIPQYMLRHKVKAGITGWAQVNGWRGNTSLEKRIEYDLYYIENWSVTLDIKIMWLTLIRVFAPNRPGPPLAINRFHQVLHATCRHHRRRRFHRLASVGGAARSRVLASSASTTC